MIVLKGRFNKTGVFLGLNTYDYILIRIKQNYYTPIWEHPIIRKKIKEKKDSSFQKRFYKRLFRGVKELRKKQFEVTYIKTGIFEFMRDLITLVFLGLTEEEVVGILGEPYTRINYRIVSTSLKALTGAESIEGVLKTLSDDSLVKKLPQEVLLNVLATLVGNYYVLAIPDKDEYKYILFEAIYYVSKSAFINLGKELVIQPTCSHYLERKPFNNVVHYCSVRPGEYSVHVFDGSDWIEVVNTIKCKKASKKVLLNLINNFSISSMDKNTIILKDPDPRKGLSEVNDKILQYITGLLRSVNRLYYYKKAGDNIEVYCFDAKTVKKSLQNRKPEKYYMILQDFIPYKVLIRKYWTDI